MYTLGLNLYHADSSACIFKGTELVAAAEEERFVREKHWAGIPLNAIEFCLNETSIKIEEIEAITVNSNIFSNFFNKIFYVVANPNFNLVSSSN